MTAEEIRNRHRSLYPEGRYCEACSGDNLVTLPCDALWALDEGVAAALSALRAKVEALHPGSGPRAAAVLRFAVLAAIDEAMLKP